MASLKRAASDASCDISSKVFVRSSRGKCTKIVRELYLRTDIPCSSQLCPICPSITPPDSLGRTRPPVLSASPAKSPIAAAAGAGAAREGHYIVPDTNIFMYCMDVIEHRSAFYDVIVLQTVLDELRNRSLPLYTRLRALTAAGGGEDGKRFYVFHNEFRRETHVLREKGESINDRNDRAVRRACAWYKAHLEVVPTRGRVGVEIVMVSDDKENLRKAREEGVVCAPVRDYVKGLKNADELLDMISAAADDAESRSTSKAKAAENLYPEYYTMSKLMTGVKASTMHQGTFHVSPYNFLEGTVSSASSPFEKPLLVLGRENINRAVQGDQVVVELLPQDQWRLPSSRIVDQEALGKNENPDGDGTEAVETSQEKRELGKEEGGGKNGEGKPQPTARVVGVTKRNWRYYVGHIDPSSAAARGRSQQTVFLIPMDKRIPKIRIKTRQASELLGKRIVVAIDSWERTSRYPVGHFVRSLGALETKEAETEALLLEHDVQYRPFPKAVLDCLPPEGHDWRVPVDPKHPGWAGRKDFRGLLVCSIDPPGCQDIDDALHARLLENGNYEVGVHIADVTHFVKPDNPMDAEAAARGTTVYLVDKRIDMLPMLLGTDLCSLKPYVERYAFSTLWEITPDAEVIDVSFTKSVIKSREAFSYEQAQLRIDNPAATDPLTEGMRTLLKLSKLLRQNRMDAGALNLASPEVRIEMESETSDPIDVQTKEQLQTNSLVEEFMLLANTSVAARIQQEFPQTALLRHHGAPPATNFEALQTQLRVRKNKNLTVTSSKALADSLDQCVDPNDPFFNTLVRILATRCMIPAAYICAGAHPVEAYTHYGLASRIYTHFTSPIRRYSDIIAHRQLAACIGAAAPHPSLRSQGGVEDVCRNLNVRHRNAQLAARASVQYYVGQAMKGRTWTGEAYVMRVFANGVVVFVPRFGVEGVVKVAEMGRAAEGVLEEGVWELVVKGVEGVQGVGLDDGLRLGLFDRVQVRVWEEKEERTGKRVVRVGLV